MSNRINRLKMWNKSLTNRVARTFFFFLFLAVIMVGSIVYFQATRSLTESVYDRLTAVATLKKDSLTRWIDQQRLNIVFIAWQPDVQRQVGVLLDDSAQAGSRESVYIALSEYLNFVVTRVSDSNELFILDLNGKVVLSTLSGHVGQNHSADLFFQEGMITTYIQPVYVSSETGRPTITVSTPLFNENKRRVGILVGHLNLARIDRIFLDRNGLGESGQTYLVSPSNEFVSATVNNVTDAAQPGMIRSKGIDAALQGQNGMDLYNNYQGVPVIGVYYWIDEQNMALVAEMSRQEAFTPARQLAFTTIEFGLLASIILAGIAYYLARQISKPILAITNTAKRVAAGDLSQVAPVMTDDEVGNLAITFNEMTHQLQLLYEGLEKKVQERTHEIVLVNQQLEGEILERRQAQDQLRAQNQYLAALHETALGMISHLDLQDLFETLVIRAGQLMNSQDGFIYIAEPGAKDIECKVGVGIFARQVGFRLQPGEGLGGTVWQTGQPLVVNDYDHWEGRAKNIDANLIRSIIGIPLKSRDQTVGVISLAYACSSEEENGFGENEIELLSRFAQLASIALENARLYAVVVVNNERIEREMLMARQVQESLLPRNMPQIEGWEFAKRWLPAREVSGDFYDLIHEAPGQLGLVMADVTDKGMPASLFTVFARSALRASLGQIRTPAGAMTAANNLICQDSFEGLFATLFYARLMVNSGQITYVNAGHNPALLYRAQQDDMDILKRTGLPLGVMENSEYEEREIALQSGDFIFLYTDGITEAVNADEEEFGLERLRQVLFDLRRYSTAEIISGIEEAFAEYADPAQSFDDITMMVVRRL